MDKRNVWLMVRHASLDVQEYPVIINLFTDKPTKDDLHRQAYDDVEAITDLSDNSTFDIKRCNAEMEEWDVTYSVYEVSALSLNITLKPRADALRRIPRNAKLWSLGRS